MDGPPHIALDVPYTPMFRAILRGIQSYAARHARWTFEANSMKNAKVLRWIRQECDGVLTCSGDRAWHRRLRGLGLPVVAAVPHMHRASIPLVSEDHVAVGKLVAEYLLERGYRHFGLVTSPHREPADGREAGFRSTIRRAGYRVHRYLPRAIPDPERMRAPLSAWVGSLPRPIAILAVTDSQGLQLLSVCRRLGIAAPDELAVVSVGNDVEMCSMCQPPLSSVAFAYEGMGYEAACLLDRLIQGEAPPTEPVRCAPQGVMTRASSEVRAVDDPIIARASRYIAAHACDRISVQDVARHVGCSYRRLHERYQRALGHRLHEAIRDVQLNRAKRLLAESPMPIHQVAVECGWTDGKQIDRIFKQHVGLTPSGYRAQFRSPVR